MSNFFRKLRLQGFLFAMVSLLLFICCKAEGDSSNNKYPVVGTYINNYVKGAENLLVLNKDGTFNQTFTNQNGTKTNTGTYTFFKENCRIRFDSLVFLHNIPKQYQAMNIYTYPAAHRNDNILFQDHYNLSFLRQE